MFARHLPTSYKTTLAIKAAVEPLNEVVQLLIAGNFINACESSSIPYACCWISLIHTKLRELLPNAGVSVKRRTVLLALAPPFWPRWSQGSEAAHEVQLYVPLLIETLSSDTPMPQIGIVVSDLAKADKQISTVLLRGLQNLGLLIEAPALDLDKFLLPGQEWRSSVLELSPDWVAEHNGFVGASELPAGRIYGVRYTGRYQYATAMLHIALTIELFERSALGPLRRASATYSSRFFADKLERSIYSQLTAGKRDP